MEDIYKLLGVNIRYFRKAAGFSQEKLAELGGFSTAFIGQLERGHNKASLATVEKLAGALGINSTALLSGIKQKQQVKYSLSSKMTLLLHDCPAKKQKDLEKLIYLFINKNK
ncbi:MAG: helix-turn-helix domain-containing protein [Endomicrobiales bacterium]|nr:helix-turn-helix domain-containing protein [Endomicrobiales bacterium]